MSSKPDDNGAAAHLYHHTEKNWVLCRTHTPLKMTAEPSSVKKFERQFSHLVVKCFNIGDEISLLSHKGWHWHAGKHFDTKLIPAGTFLIFDMFVNGLRLKGTIFRLVDIKCSGPELANQALVKTLIFFWVKLAWILFFLLYICQNTMTWNTPFYKKIRLADLTGYKCCQILNT